MHKAVTPISSSETAKAIARLDYDAGRAEAAERIKHQIDLAAKGLSGLTLINGGALVALFTLIGSKPEIAISMHFLWAAFACFAAGLASTIVAYFGAFVSQGQYYEVAETKSWNDQRIMFGLTAIVDPAPSLRRGLFAERLGVGSAVLALVLFIAGSGFALVGVAPG